MNITLENEEITEIRKYNEIDFIQINELNAAEQWNNLVEKEQITKEAWNNSNIAYIAEVNGQIIGYIRGLTDQAVTLYICELLINRNYRGLGIGETLLNYVHSLYPTTRMEMLASSTSHTYYEQKGYRAFYGFRKTIHE